MAGALMCLAPLSALAQAAGGLGSPTGERPATTPAPTPTTTPTPTTPAPMTPTPAPATTTPAPATPTPAAPTPTPTPGPTSAGAGAADGGPAQVIEGERMRVLVVDAASFGIDPIVGRVASERMRSTAEEMGYAVLTAEQTVAAAQQLRMPYPPTPADLWRVSWVARVHRGAFARIWAHAGQYVIEITVASLDGGGPFFARGTAGADDLRETVDRLLRTALPAPHVWNPEGAAASGTGPAPTPPPSVAATEEPIDELDDFDSVGAPETGTAPTRPAEPEPELRRWSLTLQTEAVIGAAEQVFYNHLIGLRLDFRITRDIMLGAYVAYANLNAREGRADNLLFMLQFENRIRLSSDLDLTIPLRAAVGYLPFNGPVIRLAAGLNYAFSENFEMGVDLLTPTFWILPDHTAISLDIALEGTYRF